MTTVFMKRIFAIYDFIDEYQRDYLKSPTNLETAATMKFSVAVLARYLRIMEKVGMIERANGQRRGIRLLQRKANWNALVTPEPGEYPPIRVRTVDQIGRMRNYRYYRNKGTGRPDSI